MTLDVQEFHLPGFQIVDVSDSEGLAASTGDLRLLPLARVGITMVDADQVAADERSTEVSAIGQHAGTDEFEHQGENARLPVGTPSQPGCGKEHERTDIAERMPRRACLCGAGWWHGVEVINQAGNGRQQTGSDSSHFEVSTGSPKGWGAANDADRVEDQRARQESERKRNQRGMYRVRLVVRAAPHVRLPCGTMNAKEAQSI